MKTILIFTFSILLSFSLSGQTYRGSTRTQTLEEKLNDMYCTGLFNSTHGTIIDVASNNSINGFLNVLNWLEGRVAGLRVYTSRSGIQYPTMRGSIPGIYLDEVPVSASTLNLINIHDIAIIKVIKTPFLGGANGAGGAIAIYTLGGEEEVEDGE